MNKNNILIILLILCFSISLKADQLAKPHFKETVEIAYSEDKNGQLQAQSHTTYEFKLSDYEIVFAALITICIVLVLIGLFIYSSIKSKWLITNDKLAQELKAAQDKNANSYNTIRRLTENVPGAIYQYRVYPDGRAEFPYCSHGMTNVYELSPDDVIKNPEYIIQYIHKEDQSKFIHSVKKSMKTLEEWSLEYRVVLPKKGLRWLYGKSTPEKLSDGSVLWSGIIDDITTRIKYEKELQAKKQELEIVIQNTPSPMILHNEDGTILMMNNAWIKTTGFSHAETLTMNQLVDNLYQNTEERIEVKAHIQSMYSITEKIDEGEFSFFNRNNDFVTLHFSSSLLGLINNKKTIIASAVDVTELKKKDSLIHEQSKLAAMGEMIGNIAHQWRQPLSVISTGATGMLVQKEYDLLDDELFIKTCNDINDNAQYLSKTIDDFKNFIKDDQLKVSFDLNQEIKSFIELVNGDINQQDIDLVLELQENIIIDGHPNELKQCLINIFNNAKDALNEKNIEDKFIFITTTATNNAVTISIKDNAKGIPEDILSKIFEPYFTTKHQSQGTGLGLSITYNLIEDGMKGNIKASNISYTYNNQKYTGAEFKITLPLS